MRLKDKVAIITGASRGIGEAIALGYAREGAHVVLAARTRDLLEQVAAKVRAMGRKAMPIPTDVTVEDQVEDMVRRAMDAFGRIDILVNNAGGAMVKPVWATSLNTWEWLMGVNLRAPFLCTKHVWRIMQDQGGGSIINIGSTFGSRSAPWFAAYSASKWGLVGLTKATAQEGRQDNIRVNIINPGKVRTAQRANINDKDPILEAEDIVGAAVFLASDAAQAIHGQVIEMEHMLDGVTPRKRRSKPLMHETK
jgi:NAD(P)-dependent dehydrogenase (short-subunit alcohol dehydrogenase family)